MYKNLSRKQYAGGPETCRSTNAPEQHTLEHTGRSAERGRGREDGNRSLRDNHEEF